MFAVLHASSGTPLDTLVEVAQAFTPRFQVVGPFVLLDVGGLSALFGTRPRSLGDTLHSACPACRAVALASTASAALLLACGREGLTVLEPAAQKAALAAAPHRRAHRGDRGPVVGHDPGRAGLDRARAGLVSVEPAGPVSAERADTVSRGGVAAPAGHASGAPHPPPAPASGRGRREASGPDDVAAVRGYAAAVGHSSPGGAGRAAASRRARAAGRTGRGLAASRLRRRRGAAGAVAGRAGVRGPARARVAHRGVRAAVVRAGAAARAAGRRPRIARIAVPWPSARRCTSPAGRCTCG